MEDFVLIKETLKEGIPLRKWMEQLFHNNKNDSHFLIKESLESEECENIRQRILLMKAIEGFVLSLLEFPRTISRLK